MEPQWIRWARRIQALAQTGLAFATDPYDRDRYQALRELAVEMVAAHVELPTDGERLKLRELFAGESGYPTPKVDVRAAVFDGDRVLLVKERSDGRWSLPGGWADVGSSPSETAVREVAEETGYRVRPLRLLALWDNSRHHDRPVAYAVYKVCIACALEGGEPRGGVETEAVGWFPVGALPPLSVTRITPEQVRRLHRLYTHPELPPEFD